MGKCLVIGASSFIGVYAVDALLKAGFEVVGTGRNPKFRNHYVEMDVEYIHLDLDDPKRLKDLPSDFDVVVHLAGRLPANSTFDLKSEDDAAKYIATNTLGTAHLLEWCRRNEIQRVVSTTSYADVQNRWSAADPIKEDWYRDYRMSGDHAAYIISKNASSDLLMYYNCQYGMKNCVFRLPPVYGCGPHESLRVNGAVRKSGIGLFVEKAKAGEPITVFGDAETAVRDIVYVKDVAQAIVRVCEAESASGLYNVGSGNAVSLLEQAEAISEVFAGPAGRSAVVVDPNRENGITPYRLDIGKAQNDFGYSPDFSNFKSMMEDWKREEERGVIPALFSVE